jgi:hypothetical protein
VAGLLLSGATPAPWLAGPLAALAARQPPPAEYRLKAAFVAKFPEFTEWPDDALAGRKTIDLCIARPNPFGAALAELVAGETVHGRPFAIREVTGAEAIDTCHVLFVPALSPAVRKALLSRATSRPALTIGDYPEFLDEGGIVHLQMAGGRVRFEINATAARRVGLHLSSQLLRLAVAVHERPS